MLQDHKTLLRKLMMSSVVKNKLILLFYILFCNTDSSLSGFNTLWWWWWWWGGGGGGGQKGNRGVCVTIAYTFSLCAILCMKDVENFEMWLTFTFSLFCWVE